MGERTCVAMSTAAKGGRDPAWQTHPRSASPSAMSCIRGLRASSARSAAASEGNTWRSSRTGSPVTRSTVKRKAASLVRSRARTKTSDYEGAGEGGGVAVREVGVEVSRYGRCVGTGRGSGVRRPGGTEGEIGDRRYAPHADQRRGKCGRGACWSFGGRGAEMGKGFGRRLGGVGSVADAAERADRFVRKLIAL